MQGWENAIKFSEELRKDVLNGAISTEELPFHFASVMEPETRKKIFGDMPNHYTETHLWEDHWQQKNKTMREALEALKSAFGSTLEPPPPKKLKTTPTVDDL